jgi:flagellin
MLSLHTNVAALSAQNSITSTQSSLSTSMTRLSTGYRINSAMDDAAGLQIATRLKAQSSGMAVAMRNTQNSISMMQTAEGSLNEVTNILTRMKDLATGAADGSAAASDQTADQAEYDSLADDLSNIVQNTSFGGTHLLNGTDGKFATGGVDFQIGATSAEKMTFDISASITSGATSMNKELGLASARFSDGGTVTATVTGSTAGSELNSTNANTTIDKLQSAIDSVSQVRSALGAGANSLQHIANNLANVNTNTQAAIGRIMDVDFASESSNMTSNQMLLQAGTAMLKQTNSMSSMVMSLLQ